jgi:hypothetical protein
MGHQPCRMTNYTRSSDLLHCYRRDYSHSSSSSNQHREDAVLGTMKNELTVFGWSSYDFETVRDWRSGADSEPVPWFRLRNY